MRVILCACLLFGAGCMSAPVMPRTEGGHSEAWKPVDRTKPPVHMVLGDDPAAVSAVIAVMRENGARIVERSQAEAILREQPSRLTHPSDRQADVVAAGKIVGADSVIFVDSFVTSVVTPVIDGDIGTYKTWVFGHVSIRFDASIAIRLVSVATGEELWHGRAWFPRPVRYPKGIYSFLAHAAMVRATCPIESGAVWNDREWCVRHD